MHRSEAGQRPAIPRRMLLVFACIAFAASPMVASEEDAADSGSAGLTDDVSTDLRSDEGNFRIYFGKTNKDWLELQGELNGRLVGDGAENVAFRFEMAGIDISGTLNENGNFRTESDASPRLRISIRQKSGEFLFRLSRATLAERFRSYGVLQQKVVKPGIPVLVPIRLTVGWTVMEFSVQYAYVGSDKSGTGKYKWRRTGKHGSGLLLFNRALVEEDPEHPQHRFKIQGFLARPDQPEIVRSDSGNWVISIGSYTQTIPCVQMNGKGKRHITFRAEKGGYGIKRMDLDTKKWTLYISTRGILADPGSGRGTSFPLVGSTLTSTTFVVSVALDLDNGESFSASTLVYVRRDQVGLREWIGLKKPKSGGGGGDDFQWPIPYYGF